MVQLTWTLATVCYWIGKFVTYIGLVKKSPREKRKEKNQGKIEKRSLFIFVLWVIIWFFVTGKKKVEKKRYKKYCASVFELGLTATSVF
jgi:hypothetical protein